MVEAVPLSNIIVCALFLLNTASQRWNDAAALILSFIEAKVYWVMYNMLGTKLLLLPVNTMKPKHKNKHLKAER